MEDKKKIFITGGSGFIGQALTRELKNHSLTFGLSSENPASVCPKEYECINLKQLRPADIQGYDAVIHLAARVHKINDNSNDSLAIYRESNLDLTLTLGKISIEAGVKQFIFASSVKAGNCEDKQTDSSQVGKKKTQDDNYSITKLEAEYALEKLFTKQSNSQCLVLRLPLVYGPGVKGNVLRFLAMAKKGIRLPLKAVKGKRSMLYVRNLSDAFSNIIRNKTSVQSSFQRYYLTDGHDITSNEMYSMIYKLLWGEGGTFYLPETILRLTGFVCTGLEAVSGKNLPFNKEAVSRLFDEYKFSSSAFCGDYNWKPPYTPDEGISETVKWFLSDNR